MLRHETAVCPDHLLCCADSLNEVGGGVASTGSSPLSSSGKSGDWQRTESGEARRRRKGGGGAGVVAVPVMLSDETVRELRPREWRQSKPLGRGGFGTVYRATWRGGLPVAVKEITLPETPANSHSVAAAKEQQAQAAAVVDDFVKEVEVACDLNHPNLVQLVGYATQPRLLIVQELLAGGGLDHQLYIEKWRPNREQVLKIGLDVAKGMAHLHTAFERVEEHFRASIGAMEVCPTHHVASFSVSSRTVPVLGRSRLVRLTRYLLARLTRPTRQSSTATSNHQICSSSHRLRPRTQLTVAQPRRRTYRW